MIEARKDSLNCWHQVIRLLSNLTGTPYTHNDKKYSATLPDRIAVLNTLKILIHEYGFKIVTNDKEKKLFELMRISYSKKMKRLYYSIISIEPNEYREGTFKIYGEYGIRYRRSIWSQQYRENCFTGNETKEDINPYR